MSGVLVSLLSIIAKLIQIFIDRNTSAKELRVLKEYSEIYAVLSDSPATKKSVEKLLNYETGRLLARVNRKLNKTNIAIVFVVALFGGVVSYGLASLATSTSNLLLRILAWTVFVLVVIFTIGISITGFNARYDPAVGDKGTEASKETKK